MGCWASVHQNEIGVVERCGRFQSFQQPGFSCLFPIIDNLVGTLDLRVQQFKMKTESKSRDNVFVTVSIAVQYRVVPEDMYDAFYKLQSPISHIQLYIHSVVRSTIPTLSLDELFNAKDSIAVSVQKGVEQEFFDNGYHVVQVLVEDIIPDTGVRDAINEISAQDRLKVANVAKADAEKIVRVMEAEAYGESQHLSGLGLARSRRVYNQHLKAHTFVGGFCGGFKKSNDNAKFFFSSSPSGFVLHDGLTSFFIFLPLV
eukprot:TRINITY_DN9421_c0_g1_i2.p1 TRINITY_DN9421_c0_g1~~TRINITY_DN9421_c0_g1_i2.p1  ORF type:complete len:258 (+),score=44.28 TRINITY_DN9421_c0_g1_i2:269-1042(+)